MNKKLIKALDAVFSYFIRQKDANEEGFVKCYTCGKYFYWLYIQCGHYVSRTHYGTRWEEKNCKPQCEGCNVFREGVKDVFARNLVREYGPQILELLAAKKNNIVKLHDFEFKVLINQYKSKLRWQR